MSNGEIVLKGGFVVVFRCFVGWKWYICFLVWIFFIDVFKIVVKDCVKILKYVLIYVYNIFIIYSYLVLVFR